MRHRTPAASRTAPRRALAAAAAVALSAGLALGYAPPVVAVNTAHDRLVSADPANWTPHVSNGAVLSVVQLGSFLVAVGTFTAVTQTTTSAPVTRNRIVAFDAVTGQLDMSFDPNLNAAASSIDTDGTYLYVGGSFTTVGGVTARKVAKLTATGQLVRDAKGASLLKGASADVNDVVVRGNRLYLGGAFTWVGGVTTVRHALAALDTTTGAVLPEVAVSFDGLYNGGSTRIKRFDVSPDGRSLVAVGNFTSVGGVPHSQVAVLDTPPGAAATVASWATNRFDAARNACSSSFDTFTRDVDYSPDGSFFVISTTGAFAGGAASATMCDTISRWERTTSSTAQPTWLDYTGGDTSYGVAVTGTAVYVGGHFRWMNNPFQSDQAGPGAVAREGIAALDPANGLPLSWNPGRARGVGAQALYATPAGLWVGSDTSVIGRETHRRIAFFPLAGGKVVPAVTAPALPGSLLLAQRGTGGSSPVLWRVNAGGPVLQSGDAGPDWRTDAGLVSGGSATTLSSTVAADATVPTGTAPDVFRSERWGVQTWHLPVAAGTQVSVRLYFADQFGSTRAVGQRVFDVNVDGGAVELDNFDIVAAAGDHRGTMRAIPVTSDGTVDIAFTSVVQNPLVDAIEVVAAGTATAAAPAPLVRRPVDASGAPTAAASTLDATVDWGAVRGTFLVGSTLYHGLPDGRLYARTLDPATGAVGPQRALTRYDDPDDTTRVPFMVANLTGAFYEPVAHRLYYTLFGSAALYYRAFTPESEVVGAQQFVADAGGVSFATVSGMTYASGRILYGSSADGALRSVAFDGVRVTGAPVVVSSDGTWRARGMAVGGV